jgi:hypothetical protein
MHMVLRKLRQLYDNIGKRSQLSKLDTTELRKWQQSNVQYRVCAVPTVWLPPEARDESYRIALNTLAGFKQKQLQKEEHLFTVRQQIKHYAEAQSIQRKQEYLEKQKDYFKSMLKEYLKELNAQNQLTRRGPGDPMNPTDYTLMIYEDDGTENSQTLAPPCQLANRLCAEINDLGLELGQLVEHQSSTDENQEKVRQLSDRIGRLLSVMVGDPPLDESHKESSADDPDPLLNNTGQAHRDMLVNAVKRLINKSERLMQQDTQLESAIKLWHNAADKLGIESSLAPKPW